MSYLTRTNARFTYGLRSIGPLPIGDTLSCDASWHVSGFVDSREPLVAHYSCQCRSEPRSRATPYHGMPSKPGKTHSTTRHAYARLDGIECIAHGDYGRIGRSSKGQGQGSLQGVPLLDDPKLTSLLRGSVWFASSRSRTAASERSVNGPCAR